MNRFFLILGLSLISMSGHAVDLQCPKKWDRSLDKPIPPSGWSTYKGHGSEPIAKLESLGALERVSVHDGSPDEVLGDLIPDNDETGKEQGFWLWTVKGILPVYVGCEYSGTNVILIKKIEDRNLRSCRVPSHGPKRNVLTCRQ